MDYLNSGNDLVRSLYIPDTLREEFPDASLNDPATIGSASIAYCMSGADYMGAPNAIRAARGLIDHQEAMFSRKKNDKGETVPACAWFSARRIIDVGIIERMTGTHKDQLLGIKARITFEPENGDEDEETIDTGWIDYYGWEALPFEVSLSRTIAAIAALNRDEDSDRKVSLRKQLTEKGKKKNRHACDIRAVSGEIETLAGVLCQNIEVLETLIEDGSGAALDHARDLGLIDSLEDFVYGLPGFADEAPGAPKDSDDTEVKKTDEGAAEDDWGDEEADDADESDDDSDDDDDWEEEDEEAEWDDEEEDGVDEDDFEDGQGRD